MQPKSVSAPLVSITLDVFVDTTGRLTVDRKITYLDTIGSNLDHFTEDDLHRWRGQLLDLSNRAAEITQTMRNMADVYPQRMIQ